MSPSKLQFRFEISTPEKEARDNIPGGVEEGVTSSTDGLSEAGTIVTIAGPGGRSNSDMALKS